MRACPAKTRSEESVTVYICDRCTGSVTQLRDKKPEEWTNEEKENIGGMAGGLIKGYGKLGLVLVFSLFQFAMWFLKSKLSDGGENSFADATTGFAEPDSLDFEIDPFPKDDTVLFGEESTSFSSSEE